MAVWFGTPPGVVLQEELESVQKRAVRFVTGNYNYETGSMTGILGQLKWESLKKRRKDNRLILLYKGLKGKTSVTLSPKLGTVEISTLWHFRLPLPIQMFIKVASSPRLTGIGMPSLILWSHPLKMQRIVLLSSLLWWELGTNSLITGPGEWLSFRRFTSKLSWPQMSAKIDKIAIWVLLQKMTIAGEYLSQQHCTCNKLCTWYKMKLKTDMSLL